MDASLKLFIVFCRTYAALEAADGKDIKKYGLSRSEFGVLELLYHKGPQTVQDIGKKILLTSGSMTYVVNKLTEKGLAIRETCEKDRRIYYVQLTEEGEKLIQTVFPEHAKFIKDMFSALSEEEQTALTTTLKRISDTIREDALL